MLKVAFISLVLIAFCASFALAWPRHGAPVGGGPITPGLHLGAYGSTTASGWTTIGPSNGTLASTATTNIIYVSDSLGNDDRDGSTPTFIDDNNTVQFQVTSAHAFTSDIYKDFVSGQSCTVAVTINPSTFIQCASRTGSTFSASGTLTKQSGTGDATIAYSSFTLGIHGPVKTIIKAIGGNGPAAYNLDHNSPVTGDGTGLGTIGNWRTAGGVGSAFALRNGMPDWVLLRMGDTFTGQAIEKAFDASGGSDNFGLNGFSEQEPMVISAYDESVPATTPNLGSGARARPIILVPAATTAYAAMQTAGTIHLYYGRTGLQLNAFNGNFVAVMGIDFYAAQRDPGSLLGSQTYVGVGNVADTTGVDHRGMQTGALIEDVRTRWFFTGISFENASGSITVPSNFDITVRRSQSDHCYQTLGGHSLGIVVDSVAAANGGLGGAMSPGFTFDENVMDLCGYPNPSFTGGDDFSRDAYLQGDTIFGSRQGNTAVRSSSENTQFRSGGVINDNFVYNGSYGFDVGHDEGFPALASNTVVTNNVIMAPISPTGKAPIAINYLNSNNITTTGNIIADLDSSVNLSASALFAQTDALNGQITLVTTTTAGSGGIQGDYAIGAGAACFGGANFTGGHGTNASSFALKIGAGGTITGDPTFVEPNGSAWQVSDVLTPVANYPSLRTAGVSFTAVGSGGTPGDYGIAFGHCPRDPAVPVSGDTQTGVSLTNFSGSMAGSGALASFTFNSFSSTTRSLISSTYHAIGVTTVPNTIGNSVFSGGGTGVATQTITTTGFTPSAYNGTWTIDRVNGTSLTQLVWDLGTAVDPGPVTVQGKVAAFAIISTGVAYVAGDVLTAASTDVGGQTGIRLTVGSVAHLSGWTITVARVESSGTHGLAYTGNIIFNWPGTGPPAFGDGGGIHDGAGAANVWSPNTICTTAQFTGAISGSTTLATSAVVNGPIASSTNLAGPGVTANTTIVSGGPTSWVISPSNPNISAETMYSYTCSPTKVYAHPERTVQTYAALHGQAASIDGYMTKALANAKWNWDPTWTANNGLNPYIRLGFQ